MRTLTLHTADELVERWKRRAGIADLEAGGCSSDRPGRMLAAMYQERAQAYRVCAAELLAILAASMEMEAAHHEDPECRQCREGLGFDEARHDCGTHHPDYHDGRPCYRPESWCIFCDSEPEPDPNALREWLAGERP